MTDFWIKKNDTLICQKRRFDHIVALCILLERLSCPYRCKDMVPLFVWNLTELRLIFTLDFIYQRQHHRRESWNITFFITAIFIEITDAIAGKGVPSYNWFGFVDGTVARICRPILDEKVVYSGHTKVHGAKFQSVVLPNDLIIKLEGAMGKPKTWLYIMLYESSILNRLQWLALSNNQYLFLYGDHI